MKQCWFDIVFHVFHGWGYERFSDGIAPNHPLVLLNLFVLLGDETEIQS